MGTHKPIQYDQLLILSIFSLLFTPYLCWAVHLSDDQVIEDFHQWKEKHGKFYEHEEDIVKRFDNFKSNLQYVVERNSNSNPRGFKVGLNRFADLSNGEFKKSYFGKGRLPIRLSQRKWSHTNVGSMRSCNAPSSLDWREKGAVTPVKDQSVRGSSWAFSYVGAIEGINAINKGEVISLSEQVLLDSDKIRDYCNGGYKVKEDTVEWIINYGGIHTQTNYPDSDLHGTARKVANKFVDVDGYKYAEALESALLCATTYQPISVGLHASSVDFQLYMGGIYDGACSSEPNDIDHVVLIVGYGSEDGTDYWIIKNSWGTGWGMDGYMYLRRNTNLPYGVCAINAQASYPTLTSSCLSPYLSPSSAPTTSPPPSPPSPPPSPPPSVPPPPPSPSISPPPPIPTPPSPPLSPSPSPPLPTPPPASPTPPPPAPSPPPYNPPSNPPPSPSTPYQPPTPPPPSPSYCGYYSYCAPGQTCCCLFEVSSFCMIHGCCDYSDGVCCTGTDYCCPHDYPVCDVNEGICLKKSRDYLGVSAKKKKLAKLKLPWSIHEDSEDTPHRPLQWRRDPFAAAR